MILREWANAWGIPLAAIVDLEQRVGLFGTPNVDESGTRSEAYTQSAVRLEAAQKGVLLFRNNVGAFKDEYGNFVRFGLANESDKQNKVLKSGDLIGVRKKLITPADVGTVVGQFVSREMKKPAWQYSGIEREVAQLNFATLINSYGGDACFATGVGTL